MSSLLLTVRSVNGTPRPVNKLRALVQVHQGVAVEPGGVDVVHQQLNRRLVVQNHLRLDGVLAACGMAMLNQLARIQQRVGVALQVA